MIFNSFYFNNQFLHNLNGQVVEQQETGKSIIIGSSHTTSKNNRADGSQFLYKTREARTFRRQIFFEKISQQQLDEVIAWIDTDEETIFYDCNIDNTKDYKKITCITDSSSIDTTTYFNCTENGIDYYSIILDIKFIAYNPYYYHLTETPLTYNSPGTTEKSFINEGNTNSLPTIKFVFTGTKTIKFMLNSVIYEATGTSYIEIDSENEVVKDSSKNIFATLKGGFPKLIKGTNKIKINEPTSEITTLTINKNSRWK